MYHDRAGVERGGMGSMEQGTSQSLGCSEGTSKQILEERIATNQASRGMGESEDQIFWHGQKIIHNRKKVQRPGGTRHI